MKNFFYFLLLILDTERICVETLQGAFRRKGRISNLGVYRMGEDRADG